MKKENLVSEWRVIATIFIVLFHCFCYNLGIWPFLASPTQITNYWINPIILSVLGLNMFVFISSYLYGIGYFEYGKYQQTFPVLRKKTLRLLVPYLVWVPINYALLGHFFYPKQVIGSFAHLWFLVMLFSMFFLATLSSKLWSKTTILLDLSLLVLLLAISYLDFPFRDSHLWIFSINKTLKYIPCFYFGILAAKYKLIGKNLRGGKILI